MTERKLSVEYIELNQICSGFAVSIRRAGTGEI